jgi:hypothetical protein
MSCPWLIICKFKLKKNQYFHNKVRLPPGNLLAGCYEYSKTIKIDISLSINRLLKNSSNPY